MYNKIVYDETKPWQFLDENNNLKACYIPELNEVDEKYLLYNLNKLPFTRVNYINKYNNAVYKTPRLTWAFGKVDSDVVSYRGLDFQTEVMPDWLNNLAKYCREISLLNWGFDPGYNSAIIGRYDNRDDSIGFHFDTETFLEHHFCANITLGYSRDFQFKDESKKIHQIKLKNKSLFFFLGLEHALPKRASVNPGEIRYSISFRNMCKDVGIGNSFYYCRGLNGAIDNQNKKKYVEKMNELRSSK